MQVAGIGAYGHRDTGPSLTPEAQAYRVQVAGIGAQGHEDIHVRATPLDGLPSPSMEAPAYDKLQDTAVGKTAYD
eukprot:1158659-Pelagomonas_calceolata.AAC.1